ncbi:MAG: HAMP domain-containing sensor histidine kinase [Planctomycetota bacterium]
MSRSVAPPFVLAVGAASAVVLGAAALLHVGDPRAGARAELERSAVTRASEVQLAWERLLRYPTPPAPALGLDLTFDPTVRDARFGATRATDGSVERSPLFDVLLDAAVAAGRSGDLGAALTAVEDALEREPDAARAAEAHLHAATWWSALGSPTEVDRHRRAIPPEATLEGTSVALLAALVAPIDAAAAAALLEGDTSPLPPPTDRARVRGGRIEVTLDPWWQTFEDALAEAAPQSDWSAAFLRDERAASAVARAIGPVDDMPPDLWTFRDLGDGLVALRRSTDGVRALAVARESLVSKLRVACEREVAPPFHLWLGAEEDLENDSRHVPLTVARPLPGLDVVHVVAHEDPDAVGRAEARRLALVRTALGALAVLVLVGSIVVARGLRRARRLTELRSTFVASVSHDLRTPTQAILLLAETLEQDRVATEASRTRYHREIRREAERLRRLVEDLLDGARVDRGDGARVDRRVVETETLLDDLESSMRERAERSGAALRMVRGRLPERLEVDPDGVRRAVWNLFENALLHGGGEDGAVEVTVEVRLSGGALEVTVTDDGPGVPARLREAIFEPFERVADRHERDGMQSDTGTGLGLAIVRALSRAHGGDARLEPSERGARFVATFPVIDEGEPVVGEGEPVVGEGEDVA